ncbi:MAG: hypothetical protein JW722_01270 [Demequinaceae bacterium]|nr:hypothetical protein [Demequinaceae bacterium]
MKELTENGTFEKARRWSLVAAIGTIALLVVLTILESWGAIDYTSCEPDSWGYCYGDPNFWGKLEQTLTVIVGFAFAIIVMVLFVLPRKKN